MALSADYSSYSRAWTWATYFTPGVSTITLSNHDTHDADMATAIDTLAGLFVQSIPVGGVTGQVLAKASGSDRDTEWVDLTGGGGGTDLTWTAATRTISSNTGADAIVTLATTDDPGLMSSAQFDKLAAVDASATDDQTAAEIVALIDADATEEANLVTAITGNATARGALFASASGDIDAGAFSAGAVDLTTDVTGDLPFANFVTAASAGFVGATGSGDYAHRTIAQTQGDLSVDDLVTLSGVSDGDADLGTFTGSTISDNGTIKAGMQELETAIEAASSLGSLLHVRDEKADGSAGGTFTNGAERTRDFTTESYNGITGAGLVYTMGYDAQSANFTVGQTLTGGTSGATATIVADADGGAAGTLKLINVTGTFQNNETITDGGGGSATSDNASADDAGTGCDYGHQVYLPAGSYIIRAAAPGRSVNSHRAQLYDATGAAVLIVGTAEDASSAANITVRSIVQGRFTLGAPSLLEIQHQCETTTATLGFGDVTSFSGGVEVYSEMMLWQL